MIYTLILLKIAAKGLILLQADCMDHAAYPAGTFYADDAFGHGRLMVQWDTGPAPFRLKEKNHEHWLRLPCLGRARYGSWNLHDQER